MKKINTQIAKQSVFTDEYYALYIAVSNDSLFIMNKRLSCVEAIITGKDYSGLLLAFNDENEFLDAISLFKDMILTDSNPINYINSL